VTCDSCEACAATIRCRSCMQGFAFYCDACFSASHPNGCSIQHEAVRFDATGGFLGGAVAHKPAEGKAIRTVLSKCLACGDRRSETTDVVWFAAVVYGLTGAAASHVFGKWECKCGAQNGSSAMHFDCMSGTSASELSDEIFFTVPLLRFLSSLRQATGYALTTEAMQGGICLNAAASDPLASERPEQRKSRAKPLAVALRHYDAVHLMGETSNDLPPSISAVAEAGGTVDLLSCPCMLPTGIPDGFKTQSMGGDACFKLTRLENVSPILYVYVSPILLCVR